MTSQERTTDFIRLFTSHEPRLHAYVISLAPDWDDAEEILQSTNTILWEKFDEFEIGTNFFAWACKIARIEVHAFYRQRSRDRLRFEGELLDMIADEAEVLSPALSERQRQLARCMERLRPHERRLIQQRYQPGMTVRALAPQTGRSLAAIYKALQRIRAALLACTRSYEAEGEF